jgi:thioredoxin
VIEFLDGQQFKEKVFDYTKGDQWNFDGDTPIVLNLFATWCGPCRMFTPVLEDVANEFDGKIKVYKVDTDAVPEVPALFGTRGVPATLFIKKGQEPALAMGALPLETMRKAINEEFFKS